MKLPICDNPLIDLDAPVLPGYEAIVKGVTRWVVY